MTILVTGAAGYLGGHVMRALRDRGLNACGTARVRSSGTGHLAADLLDAASVRRVVNETKPDCIVHCAAEVPSAALGYADEQAATRSLEMVRNVLAAMNPQTTLLYVSSMTVYGVPGDTPWTEADAGDPQSAYARGKWRAEEEIRASGARAFTIRLPGLFGPPRNGGLVYNLEAAMRTGAEPTLPGEPIVWAAMHVGDAAASLAHLGQQLSEGRLPAGDAVHVACDGPHSIDGLARSLAAHYGRSLRYSVQHPVVTFDLTRARELGVAPSVDLRRAALRVRDDVLH